MVYFGMLNTIKTKDLAEYLGVSPSFASHVKHGRRKMPPKHCMRVSQHFGVPLDVLRPDIFSTLHHENNND